MSVCRWRMGKPANRNSSLTSILEPQLQLYILVLADFSGDEENLNPGIHPLGEHSLSAC